MIEVFRYDGLKSGTPIIEPLLDESSLITRGIYEMNRTSQQVNRITAAISYRGGLKLGQLVAIPDPSSDAVAKAKVVGIALEFSNGNAHQTLTLEKPVIS